MIPLLDLLLESCPTDIRPARRGYEWTFKNPGLWGADGYSTLKLGGANWQQGNMLRGQACDLALLDEVRDFKALSYFFENVLLYQFVGREDPMCLMGTTPPKTVDHDFCRPTTGFVPRAMVQERYFFLPASRNPDFTPRDKAIILNSIDGGEGSNAWRREAECELISERRSVIVPEYTDFHDKLAVATYRRPEWYVPMVTLDSGWDPDCTGIVFSYVDFLNQLEIFEGEIWGRRMTTADIAREVAKKEKELEYDRSKYKPIRIADMDQRGLADLRSQYRLNFRAADKHNREAALALFRSRLAEGKIRVVTTACPQLDYQLSHGIWNEAGTDFQRSETLGHWDLGKAAVYATKMAPWRQNPIPGNTVIQAREGKRHLRMSTWQDTLLKGMGRM